MNPIPLPTLLRWIMIISGTAYFGSWAILITAPWYYAHVDNLPGPGAHDNELNQMRAPCGLAALLIGGASSFAAFFMLIARHHVDDRMRRMIWWNAILYTVTFLAPLVIGMFFPTVNKVHE